MPKSSKLSKLDGIRSVFFIQFLSLAFFVLITFFMVNQFGKNSTFKIGRAQSTFLPPAPAGQQWRMVFSDEFNGSTLDNTKWQPVLPWGALNNNELQIYTPQQVLFNNGIMTLRAEREPQGGRDYSSGTITSYDYYSCRCNSANGLFEFQYGYAEARVKIPRGRGLWPAFWLLNKWGAGGEIDVFEILGHEPNRAYQSIHYQGGDVTRSYVGVDFSQDYHIFSVDWRADRIVFYIDGVETNRYNQNIPYPMEVILTLAVGGQWPGNPDPSTQFPADLNVDWVRVWQLQPTTSTPTPSYGPTPTPTRATTPTPTAALSTPTFTPTPTRISTPTPTISSSGQITLKFDWENSLEGWASGSTNTSNVARSSTYSRNGNYSLSANAALTRTTWSESSVRKTYSTAENWSRQGTNLTTFVYVPNITNRTGDFYGYIFIEDASYNWYSQPAVYLTPGVWNEVTWINAPLSSIKRIGVKLATWQQSYNGVFYTDYFYIGSGTTTPTPTVNTYTPTPTATINSSPIIVTNALPTGSVLTYYSANVVATDINTSNNLSMSAANVPIGFSLGNCTQNIVSGVKRITCRLTGTSSITVDRNIIFTATDGNSSIQKTLRLVIN